MMTKVLSGVSQTFFLSSMIRLSECREEKRLSEVSLNTWNSMGVEGQGRGGSRARAWRVKGVEGGMVEERGRI